MSESKGVMLLGKGKRITGQTWEWQEHGLYTGWSDYIILVLLITTDESSNGTVGYGKVAVPVKNILFTTGKLVFWHVDLLSQQVNLLYRYVDVLHWHG